MKPKYAKQEYGANHLVTTTYVQMQNYLGGQKYILLLYMGISKAMKGEHLMQYSPAGLLGIAEHATFQCSGYQNG